MVYFWCLFDDDKIQMPIIQNKIQTFVDYQYNRGVVGRAG